MTAVDSTKSALHTAETLTANLLCSTDSITVVSETLGHLREDLSGLREERAKRGPRSVGSPARAQPIRLGKRKD